MALLTPEELRKRGAPFPIELIGGGEVTVRRIDIRLLIYTGILKTPLLSKANELISKWVGQDLTLLSEETQAQEGLEALGELNMLVSWAMVYPRVILTEAERQSEKDVLIDDIDIPDRERIVLMAQRSKEEVRLAEEAAAAKFSGKPNGDAIGPDVPKVRAKTKRRARDSGQGSSAGLRSSDVSVDPAGTEDAGAGSSGNG